MDAIEFLSTGCVQISDNHLSTIGQRAAETRQRRVTPTARICGRFDDVGAATRERATNQVLLVGLAVYILNLQRECGRWIGRVETGSVLEQVVLARSVGILIGQR